MKKQTAAFIKYPAQKEFLDSPAGIKLLDAMLDADNCGETVLIVTAAIAMNNALEKCYQHVHPHKNGFKVV